MRRWAIWTMRSANCGERLFGEMNSLVAMSRFARPPHLQLALRQPERRIGPSRLEAGRSTDARRAKRVICWSLPPRVCSEKTWAELCDRARSLEQAITDAYAWFASRS